jgi:hypothetical protein
MLFLLMPNTGIDSSRWTEVYGTDARASSLLYEDSPGAPYHPNRVFDGDGSTAWVSEGPGEGQRIEWRVAPVSGAELARVDILPGRWAGDHAAFEAYATPRRVTVSLLDVGGSVVTSVEATLERRPESQQVRLGVPRGAVFSGVRVDIATTFPGMSYRSMAISEVEVHVPLEAVVDYRTNRASIDASNAWRSEHGPIHRTGLPTWFAGAQFKAITEEEVRCDVATVEGELIPYRALFETTRAQPGWYAVSAVSEVEAPASVDLPTEVLPLVATENLRLTAVGEEVARHDGARGALDDR